MADDILRLFLCGDVMLGRGIDQVMPQSCASRLHEPYVKDARDYVALAERTNGPVPAPVSPAYVWGDALPALQAAAPDLRLINLETAVTCDGEPWPGKDIHYRMHPANLASLQALGADACALANNHVLDWSESGLRETLAALSGAGIAHAGAGEDAGAAQAPALLPAGEHVSLRLFSACLGDSGVPDDWAATGERPGVYLLAGDRDVRTLADTIAETRRPGDIVAVSLHWGGNWGYAVPDAHRRLARRLIEAGADLIHGHSGHHPKGMELYRGRLILYGCGDFINDYEGIGGHERFRPELVAGYLVVLAPTGGLVELALLPFRVRRFRLEEAGADDARWLADRLTAESPDPDLSFRVAAGGVSLQVGAR